MGDSKGVRNAIIAVMILGAAIYFIIQYTEGFVLYQTKQSGQTSNQTFLKPFMDIFISSRALFNLFLMGLGVLFLILIIAYIAKRREERKESKEAKPLKPAYR